MAESNCLDLPTPCLTHYGHLCPAPASQGMLVSHCAFVFFSRGRDHEVCSSSQARACARGMVLQMWVWERVYEAGECEWSPVDSQGRAGGLRLAPLTCPPPFRTTQSLTRSHSCFKALPVFRAVCYCLCHHKFKKGKLIKYGTRLSNIF